MNATEQRNHKTALGALASEFAGYAEVETRKIEEMDNTITQQAIKIAALEELLRNTIRDIPRLAHVGL